MKRPENRRSGPVARFAGSPCRMEVLEPRLLLANELIVGFGDVNFKDPQLPGDKIEVPVTFQNVSAARITGKVRVEIYASTGGGGFLCAVKDVNINPRANEIQTKRITATLPLDLVPDNYFFIAFVVEDESMLPAGVTFLESSAEDNEMFSQRWQFGDVDGRSGNTTLRFMNDSGVIYKVNFSAGFDGSESGEINLEFLSGGLAENQGAARAITPYALTFENTGFDDKISVRRAGGPSEPELFYLTGIGSQFEGRGGNSSLGFFDASDLTLYGPAEFEGGLHKLFLGNVTYAGIIEIDNENEFGERVSIKVRDVLGTIFDIDGVLANMKADSFSGLAGDPSLSSLRGPPPPPLLGGITATVIEKIEIRNDFEGVVTAGFLDQVLRNGKLPLLDGGRVVGRFTVGGILTGGFFADGGDVARIQAGEIYDWRCSVQGRLERLVVEGGINAVVGVRGIVGTTRIAACDISRIEVGTHVNQCQIMAGAFVALEDTGEVFALQIFNGLDNVTFKAGTIGRISIGGDVSMAQITAGVDANNQSVFNTADSFLIGDRSTSRIGPITIGGAVQNMGETFFSGDFPDSVSINGSSYSTVGDPDDIFEHVFPPV